MLARVSRVQQQLAQSWDVLSTMTPADYSAFRDSLGKSSGFQSFQYRTLEYLIGNKNAAMIEVHRRDARDLRRSCMRRCTVPACTTKRCACWAVVASRIPPTYLERDWSQPYAEHPEVTAAWLRVYRNTDEHWDLYELAEKLVDLDQRFQLWRFAHLKTVERIIGYKRGTGGSSGVSYLSKAHGAAVLPGAVERPDLDLTRVECARFRAMPARAGTGRCRKDSTTSTSSRASCCRRRKQSSATCRCRRAAEDFVYSSRAGRAPHPRPRRSAPVRRGRPVLDPRPDGRARLRRAPARAGAARRPARCCWSCASTSRSRARRSAGRA